MTAYGRYTQRHQENECIHHRGKTKVKPWTLVYWVIYVALLMSMYGASLGGLEIHKLYIYEYFQCSIL